MKLIYPKKFKISKDRTVTNKDQVRFGWSGTLYGIKGGRNEWIVIPPQEVKINLRGGETYIETDKDLFNAAVNFAEQVLKPNGY